MNIKMYDSGGAQGRRQGLPEAECPSCIQEQYVILPSDHEREFEGK